MSTRRFYLPGNFHPGETVSLPERVSSHVARVLRLGSGDQITVFDGNGRQFSAVIGERNRKTTLVQIGELSVNAIAPALKMHLGMGLLKGANMDYAMQKATELGVTEITPLISERCSVKLSGDRQLKRLEHWREICINSCEQCGRHYLPVVHPVTEFDDWLRRIDSETKMIFLPQADRHLADAGDHSSSVGLLVGPEGGFTDTEIGLAERAGFVGTRLGPRTLRAETVPLVALTLSQYLWGDLKAL